MSAQHGSVAEFGRPVAALACAVVSPAMAGRIVVFGATGYTGDLTARTLVERGARPVLAARNEDRVRALAQELGGLEWAVADVERPKSVRALVERGDVLVSTVGPFARWGSAAIQAAIGGGALPGLDRRKPLHPRGLRALRLRRAGRGVRAGDRVRLRLGAGQSGRRAGAARGRRSRHARRHRLLHAGHRQGDLVSERRHAGQRSRDRARARLRLARRAPGRQSSTRSDCKSQSRRGMSAATSVPPAVALSTRSGSGESSARPRSLWEKSQSPLSSRPAAMLMMHPPDSHDGSRLLEGERHEPRPRLRA
jgi:hypothetical protein